MSTNSIINISKEKAMIDQAKSDIKRIGFDTAHFIFSVVSIIIFTFILSVESSGTTPEPDKLEPITHWNTLPAQALGVKDGIFYFGDGDVLRVGGMDSVAGKNQFCQYTCTSLVSQITCIDTDSDQVIIATKTNGIWSCNKPERDKNIFKITQIYTNADLQSDSLLYLWHKNKEVLLLFLAVNDSFKIKSINLSQPNEKPSLYIMLPKIRTGR
jgi:hypothetical protein